MRYFRFVISIFRMNRQPPPGLIITPSTIEQYQNEEKPSTSSSRQPTSDDEGDKNNDDEDEDEDDEDSRPNTVNPRRPVSAMASLPWVPQARRKGDSSPLLLSTIGTSSATSLIALSPPGLSPLTFNETASPFSLSSTPSSSSSLNRCTRFTFDHIPVDTERSAFDVVATTSEQAEEILQRVRLGSSAIIPNSPASSNVESPIDRQYYCTVCRKDFKRPDILSRHVRRHTGEKPFGCDTCGRFFSRSDHLRTHRRTHTDEKPYQCTMCTYSARRRDVLTRHMSTRHQQNLNQPQIASVPTTAKPHRSVRRCFSDGDYQQKSSASIRQRYQTSSGNTNNSTESKITYDVAIEQKIEDIEDDVIIDDNDVKS